MGYFSGIGGSVNFCQVFVLSSVMLQSADRQNTALSGIR